MIALGVSSGLQRCVGHEPLEFNVQMLAVDANEGIAAGDIDGDGKTDLVAGRHWYRNGDWVARPVRNIDDWNGYVESNGDYLFDVNGDGRLDVIAGSFLPTKVYWYENPGPEALRLGKLWPKHLLKDTKHSRNEGQLFEDLDGDGQPEWIVNSWQKDCPMMVYRLVDRPVRKEAKPNPNKVDSGARYAFAAHMLGDNGNGHGVAVGDLNGDGKKDVLVGQGWYQQPAEGPWDGPWEFHPDWDIHSSLPMIVADLDQDGDSDMIVGQGHDYGLEWWEQIDAEKETGKLQFKKHEIDSSFSQPHSLAWVDLDGDGSNELITGKRYYAHNSKDPGGNEPPCLYYFTWDAETGSFERHTIDEGHIGTGLQIIAQDLNGDSKVDIAVAGKSGTYLLLAK